MFVSPPSSHLPICPTPPSSSSPSPQDLLLFLYRYHRLISFMLYMSVFILFVLTLQKGYYKVQFKLVSHTEGACCRAHGLVKTV